MRHLVSFFESTVHQPSTLIIVDVQKSFAKFFNNKYLSKLNKYAKQFENVYQIWDNHIDGNNPDPDYLYDHDPDIENSSDLYKFNNQKDLIEKRYNYNVNVDFYKKILDEEVFKRIKQLESQNALKKGDLFKTKEGTCIVYIGNNHKWHHVGKKLYNLFVDLIDKDVVITGGSNGECLEDVFISAQSIGVLIKKDIRYIYSATHCP